MSSPGTADAVAYVRNNTTKPGFDPTLEASKLLAPDLTDIARQAAMSGALGKTKRSNGRAASFLGAAPGGGSDVLGSTSALGGPILGGK